MAETQERSCPVCASRQHVPFASEHINTDKITEFTYASRKQPEFMRHRMVRCCSCDLVYVPAPPDSATLTTAYEQAAYDSSEEADCAALTYARVLQPHLTRLTKRDVAVDIGAGNGAFLPHLKEVGFKTALGVEPSRAAAEAATPELQKDIIVDMFRPELLAGIRPSLITSFMTLEHVDDPFALVRSVHDALAPGGMIAIVVHNRLGFLNRILGLRSPIMDVEHLQLFNPQSVHTLLERAGFSGISIQSFSNSYPLSYWLRLTPLPSRLKRCALSACEVLHVARLRLPMYVGNIFCIAQKNT